MILLSDTSTGVLSFIHVNWYNADITSSTTTAVHKSSIASSLELPDNNGGERLAVNVGAKTYILSSPLEVIHKQYYNYVYTNVKLNI